jgi:spoIIIJ-associated protein
MIRELRPTRFEECFVEAPQSIEAIGTTVEEAIARALEALNVQRRDVDIQVISAESDRRARVRVTIKEYVEPTSAPASDEAPIEEATPEDADTVERVLTDLLSKMHMPAQIEALAPTALKGYEHGDGPTLALNLRGPDLSNLIGRRGETLDSLQYLTRMLVAKELGYYVNVVIDVEGYKAHRVQTLQQLAHRMAERVTTTHKPAALEPMPPNERRIVHLTLRDHPDVRTESVGNGENRKVTIIPKSYKR